MILTAAQVSVSIMSAPYVSVRMAVSLPNHQVAMKTLIVLRHMSAEIDCVFRSFVSRQPNALPGKSAKMDFAFIYLKEIKQFALLMQIVKRIKFVARKDACLPALQQLSVQLVLPALMSYAELNDADMIMTVVLGCIAVMVNVYM